MSKIIFILICLFGTIGVLTAQVERKYIRRGNNFFENQKFREAEMQYRKALEKDSKSVEASFNLGNAMYKLDEYNAATARYSGLADKAENKNELNRYYYNLGNSYFKSGKYSESIEAYKKSLLNDPNDFDAKHNLQMALRMLSQDESDKQSSSQENESVDNKESDSDDNSEMQSIGSENNNYEESRISPEDAERILQALENEEKNVLKKVLENQIDKSNVSNGKNW